MKKRILIALLSTVSLLSLSSCNTDLIFFHFFWRSDSSTSKSYLEYVPTYFEFGRYPQSAVTSEEFLETLKGASDSDGDGYIEYAGEEYAKMTPAADDASESGLTYYFKVEPIVWQIFDDGTLISNKILDSCKYYIGTPDRAIDGKKVYVNNYKYSTVRAFINGYDGSSYGTTNYEGKGFLDVAFNDQERESILTSTVKNDASTTYVDDNKYACEDTEDKIYLLSREELQNPIYAFGDDYSETNRARDLTDYASFMYGRAAIWWTRSPHSYYFNDSRHVSYQGSIYKSTVSETQGVVPALKIKV